MSISMEVADLSLRKKYTPIQSIHIRDNDIMDYHTVVLTNIGNARKKDIRKFLETCLERYSLKNREYIFGKIKINLIIDKFGIKRGIAYVYFKNSEMFNIIVGNYKNGDRRVRQVKNCHYGCDFSSRIPKYHNFCYKQDQYIEVPISEPLFDMPKLYLKEEDETRIPHIIPYHINAVPKTNTLICHHFPEWLTEEIIDKKMSIFDPDRFSFAINRSRNNPSIRITFQTNIEALFCLVMMKKIKIKNEDEVCYLFFNLLR